MALNSETLDYSGLALVRRKAVEILTAAATLSPKDSGKTFILSSSTEFAVTLPAPALGLEFEFIVGAAPSGASYTVVTNGGTDAIHGVVLITEIDTTVDGDNTSGTAEDTITFVDAKAKKGDGARVVSDGTSWYVQAWSTLHDGITLTHS